MMSKPNDNYRAKALRYSAPIVYYYDMHFDANNSEIILRCSIWLIGRNDHIVTIFNARFIFSYIISSRYVIDYLAAYNTNSYIQALGLIRAFGS